RDATTFGTELEAFAREIDAAHDHERRRADDAAPSALRLVEGRVPGAELWLDDPTRPVPVRLGRGTVPSSIEIDGVPARRVTPGDAADTRLRLLVEGAATLTDAPVVVDARHGIGIYGAPAAAMAAARGIIVQLAASLPPSEHEIVVAVGRLGAARAWDWLGALPHPVVPATTARDHTVVRFRGAKSGAEIVVALADRHEALPASVRIAMVVGGAAGELVRDPGGAARKAVRPDLVSAEQAMAWSAGAAVLARREGVVTNVFDIPSLVRPGDLAGAAADVRPGSLECVVAATAGQPLLLDLVEQGPHAVVGGTTGSGKSELLTAWVLAMARAHSQREFGVLLVDFKGGSAFAALQSLPHCVGMITDLDQVAAERALDSLAAELRRRERHLAGAGAKAIDALEAGQRMPRLVIVVDEFAAMVAGFPELHALFSDIAARGRSLGVHLILCTQRPAGVIRDAVLANSALRISLRVNNRADSVAVIGTDEAAGLAASPRGRAFVRPGDGETRLAQFPLVHTDDIAAVAAERGLDDYRPHRPWLDSLPRVILLEDLAAFAAPVNGGPAPARPGLAFGVLDDPRGQLQSLARYDPRTHGNLLVVGGAGAGKSTLLATLGSSGGERLLALPSNVEGAWDCLDSLVREIRAPSGHPEAGADRRDPGLRIVLIDDLDSLAARFTDDYEAAILDLLAVTLRDGPAAGVYCVVAAQRLSPALHTVASLCTSRLLLGMNSRQEHVLAGGDPSLYTERPVAGSGWWQGLRVQVARSNAAPARGRRVNRCTPLTVDVSSPLAVVTTRPAEFAARLVRRDARFAAPGALVPVGMRTAPLDPALAPPVGVEVSLDPLVPVIIGHPDDWQAQWGALSALRQSHIVVIDGCTAAEFHTITRSRALPPPLGSNDGSFWMMTPGGRTERGRLDG
ncbi:MAG: cell division protein, partial [Microbacteriaceae bacterium]|nr:cell division protein [Microbacteriaceae bacterium]